MRKAILGAAMAIAFLTPVAASASVTQNFMLVNGDVHGSAASGDIVNISLQETNTGLSTVQSVKVEIPGSGFPSECVDVLDENQIGAHTIAVLVNTLGTTEGQWPVILTPYGFNRVTTGSQPTDTDCTNSSGTSHTFNNQLKITNPISTGPTANNTGNGGVNGNGNNSGGTGTNNGNDGNGSVGGSGNSSGVPTWACQAFPYLTLCGGNGIPPWMASSTSHMPPPSTTDAQVCANLVSLSTGLYQGSGGIHNPSQIGAVQALQIFLMANGGTIGYGSTGYYGPQTAGAVGTVKLVHHCV